MRVWSPPTSPAISYDMIVKRAAPMEINIMLRRPAGLWRSSRSSPTAPPSTAASKSLSTITMFRSWSIAFLLATARLYKPRVTLAAASLQRKCCELRKVARASLDLAQLQRGEPLHSEALAREAAHHRTVHHRAAQGFFIHAAVAGKRAHEAAGETIARACGVVNFLEWKRGQRE